MEQELTLHDYFSIARRRFLWLLIPFLLVLGAAIAVAIVTPAIYRSTGTIMVESQQIPDELVKSTVTSFADERIEMIKQRVMTRERLLAIDQKFGLSQQADEAPSVSEIVDGLRENIAVELVSAGAGARRGRGGATIAFKVSYESRDPALAQSVANELVTLFLDENVLARTARASETTDFLAQESKRLKEQLESIEQQISDYKRENSEALPEHLGLRVEMLERAERDVKDTERDIKAAEQERRFLAIELDAVNAGSNVSDDGNVHTPAEQLALYKLQLVGLAGYSSSHPDVKDLQRKIVALQEEVDPAALRPFFSDQLVKRKRELAQAREIRTDADPQVRKLKREVAKLEEDLAALPGSVDDQPQAADPAVARVKLQIANAEARIESLREQKAQLEERIEDLQAAVLQTPQVEQALSALSRDHQGALRKYEEVRAKEMQAQLAENLEEERKAERFSLLEPPVRPDKPVRPNRKKMATFGFVLATVAGGGGLMVIESLDRSIRGPAALGQLMKQPPLVSIPYITTERELARRRRLRRLLIAGGVVALVALLLAVHFFYQPLDMLLLRVLAGFE